MPEPAPVMTATLFLRSMGSSPLAVVVFREGALRLEPSHPRHRLSPPGRVFHRPAPGKRHGRGHSTEARLDDSVRSHWGRGGVRSRTWSNRAREWSTPTGESSNIGDEVVVLIILILPAVAPADL